MKPKKAKTAPAPKRDLSTFAASHNPEVIIPNKIKAALEQLRKDGGDEAYAYEFSDPNGVPFAKLAGVGAMHLNQHREAFADYVVQVKQDIGSRRSARWVWFATPKAAKAARAA